MTRKSIALPNSLWTAIERFRAINIVGSEVEAMRRLLVEALRAHEIPIGETSADEIERSQAR